MRYPSPFPDGSDASEINRLASCRDSQRSSVAEDPERGINWVNKKI